MVSVLNMVFNVALIPESSLLSMEHSLQAHMLSLNVLCRICGNICVSKKEKKNYNHACKCSYFAADI